MLLILLFVLWRFAIGRSACDFYSRVNNSKKECCEWCIKSGMENKIKCIFKSQSNWCVSFDEALPLMCAGNGGEWFKTDIYECSLLT